MIGVSGCRVNRDVIDFHILKDSEISKSYRVLDHFHLESRRKIVSFGVELGPIRSSNYEIYEELAGNQK